MKATKEIKELSAAELDTRESELKQELFNLRFQLAVNRLENPMRIKAVKKEIAVVKTIRRQREIEANKCEGRNELWKTQETLEKQELAL